VSRGALRIDWGGDAASDTAEEIFNVRVTSGDGTGTVIVRDEGSRPRIRRHGTNGQSG
jgi:hypothetical protein